MRRALILALPLLVVAAGCGGTKTVTVTNTITQTHTVTVTKPKPPAATTTTTQTASTPCAAGALQATFEGVEGSAGAGQISYDLKLTNTSSTPCFVSGIPQGQLLGTTGNALPTTISLEPGQGGGSKVTLQHNGSATAEARFSPDVPGQGDSQSPGQCQPTSTVLRITAPGGGTVDAPVQPPTSVCERGSLHFRPFTASS